jgi:hypothetical protein
MPLACWSAWIIEKNPINMADMSAMMSRADKSAMPDSLRPRSLHFRPVVAFACPVRRPAFAIRVMVVPFIVELPAY